MSGLEPLSVRDIAEQCRTAARDEHTVNMTAIVLLLAAKAIDRLADRAVHMASVAEVAEAERDLLRRVCYGSQKGGAA